MSSDRIYKGSFTYNWRGSSVPILSVAFSGGNVMSQAGRGPLLGNYYTITDHLGSVRVVFTNRNRIEAANDYQPFGARLECYGHHSSGGDYRFNIYRFNGKPYDLSLDDYGFLDYGARVYDSRLGRWLSPDPLAESTEWISCYAYNSNNPIGRIDPDGAQDIWYYNANGRLLGNDGNMSDTRRVVVTNNREARSILRSDGPVSLGSLTSAVVLPNDVILQESLNVLDRTIANGGRREESSVVLNDNNVLRGEPGAEYVSGDAMLSAELPSLPDGYSHGDVAATIHSHMTDAFIDPQSGNPVGSDIALGPGDGAVFAKYPVNIIVGRKELPRFDSRTGEFIQSDYAISFYGSDVIDGKSYLTLNRNVVDRILNN